MIKVIVFALQICAACLSVDIVCAEQLAADNRATMIKQQQELHKDWLESKEKIAEIKRLASINDVPAAAKIMEALTDPSPLTRYIAISSLGKMKCKKAVPAITQKMFDTREDWQTRYKAANVLAQIGEPESLLQLVNYLQEVCAMNDDSVLIPYPQGRPYGTDKEFLASQIIVPIFELIKSHPALYSLLNEKMNQEKGLTDFKYYLAYILGGSEKKEATPVLIEYLGKSSNCVFRMKAAELLGGLGEQAAIEPLKKALKDDCKLERTGDRRGPLVYDMRIAAYGALKRLGVKVEKKGDEYVVMK